MMVKIENLRNIYILFGIAIVIVLCAGYYYFETVKDKVTIEKTNQLVSITTLKVGQIERFLEDKINGAKSKISSPSLITVLKDFFSNKSDESRLKVLKTLENFVNYQLYEDIIVVDKADSVMLSFEPAIQHDILEYSPDKIYQNNNQQLDYSIVYHQCEFHNKPHLDIILPINFDGVISNYYIVFRINAQDDLLKLVESLSIDSETAETVLFRREGDSVEGMSAIRHKSGISQRYKADLKHKNMPAVKAVLGEIGIVDGIDYRGVPVIAYTTKIARTDWFMLAKIDKAEIYKDVKFQTIAIVVFIILVMILLMLVFLYFHQINRKRFLLKQYEVEHKISESRHIFQTTIYSLSDGIIITDIDNVILNVNPIAEELLGFVESESKGKKIEDVIPYIFNEKLNHEIESDEVQILDKAGKAKYISIKKNNIINESGQLIGNVIVITDKTAEVINRNIITESENKFKSIFEGSSQSIMLADIETLELILVNSTSCQLFGYKQDEFMKLNVPDLHPESEHTELFEIFKELYNNNNVFVESIPCKNKNGEIFYCSINTGFLHLSGKRYAIGFYNDVSERVKSDRLLKESIERFSQVTEYSNEFIWEINIDGLYNYVNSVSESMLDYKPEELIGKKFFFDLHPIDEREEYINFARDIYENGQSFRNFENEMIRKDGQIIIVLSSGSPYYDNNGHILGYRGSDADITEQKKTEDSLKLNEERFRNISNCISDISYSCVEQNGVLSIDWMIGATKKITGFEVDELIDMSCWGKIVHPEDLPIFKQNVLDLRNGESGFCKIRLINKTGEIIWVESFAQSTNRNGKENNRIYGALLDVTESKKSDELLNKERTFFEQLFKNSPEGIVLLDNEDRVISCNDEFVKIFGYETEEITGKYINDFIVPDSLKQEGQYLTNSVAVGQEISMETTRKTKSGKLIEVSILGKPIIHTDGKQLAVYGIYRDITVRKENESALKRSEEKNRAIVEAIPDLFFIISNDGVFLDCLANNDDKLYQPKAMFIGKNVREIMPEYISDKFFNAVEKLNTTNSIQVYDYDLFMNGDNYWFDNRIARINEEQVLIISRDITHRKKAEQEFLSAKEKAEQSDRLKTSFMANMSHELRTPMSGIMGFTHLLGDPEITPEEHSEYLALLNRSNKRLLNLINDILDLSKIEAGEVEIVEMPININYLLSDVYNLHYQNAIAKNIELKINLPIKDDGAVIVSDESKHIQILNNLLNNAIKFTDVGKIEIGYQIIDDLLEFYVEDTGIGISQDFLPYLFDRFRQEDISLHRTYEGAGLGLSIVKGLIELMGGKIFVQTEKNKGTRIAYRFPAFFNQSAESDVDYQNVNFSNNIDLNLNDNEIGKILIAEDDEVNYLYIKTSLKKIKNITLIRAENGQDAVDLYQVNSRIKLVIMDIKMPVMDGLEATHRILKINPKAKIVAVTAYAQESDKDEALKAGCIDYLSKPFLPEKLLEIVTKYIE